MPVKVVVDPNSGLMGDITDAANVGAGNGWFKSQNGTVLDFYTFDVDGIIQAALNGDVWDFSLGVVPPEKGGLGISLDDPNADRILFWDDSAGNYAYLAPGNSVAITNTTLDTIQDIRSTASPTFANLNITNNGAIRTGQSLNDTVVLQSYDVDGGIFANLIYLTAANNPFVSIYSASIVQGYNGSFSIQTGMTSGNATLISAYDVDGATPVTFITLQAGNTPTCNLDDAVTKANNYIYRANGVDVSMADGGTGASLSDPNDDRLMFWDDSAGSVAWLDPITTNIISGTSLQLASGQYTPTLTDVTNVASHGTVSDFNYMRVGNTVSVSGRVSIDPTSASIDTELGISLPIASNFSLFAECGGNAICVNSAGLCAAIRADTTNDRAALKYTNTTELAAKDFSVHFVYTII